MQPSVLIIGGGLAGLAAATALAPRGFRVTLLESRNRLGGRASSFNDSATGQLIDTCQHVSMGCCTNLTHFCKTLKIDSFIAPQPTRSPGVHGPWFTHEPQSPYLPVLPLHVLDRVPQSPHDSVGSPSHD